MATGSADARATFAIDLESNAGEVAPNAARELEQLREKIRGGVDELRGMQMALRNLRGAAGVSRDTIKELQDRIAAQKAVVAQAQQRYVQLGGSFKNLRPKPTADGIKDLLEAVRATPGPLSGLVGRLGSLRALVAGGAIVGGLAAIAAVLVALVAASTAATAALTRYGLAQANARRNELLRLEGLSKHRDYWLAAAGFTHVADSAETLQGMIDSVSDQVALGREQILGYAEALYKAGLRGGTLQSVLEGMSIVAATQGEAAASHWRDWAVSMALVGSNVRKLTDDVKARLGPIAERQLLSLDVQARKLRSNLGSIFADVKLEKMLKGISQVTELFSQSTATGRALKVIAETFLNPIAEAVGSTGPIVKDFFRGMVLGAQSLTIAILEARLWFKRTFEDSKLLEGIDKARVALNLGKGAVYGLAAAFGVLALAVGLAMVPLMIVFGIGVLLGYAARKAWDAFMKIEWSALGKAVIDGIVGGIKRGVRWVKDAIGSVAGTIQSVFAQRMRIRSPSRVMFDAGVNIDTGIARGIEAARPQVVREVRELAAVPREEFAPRVAQVQAAPVRELFAPPVMREPESARIPATLDAEPRAAAAAQAPATSRSGPLVVIEQLTVQADGRDAASQALSVRRELERVLEGLAIELGARAA